MEVNELVMGIALGFGLAAVFQGFAGALSDAADRQIRIARARLAAKRAHGDRRWAEHAGSTR